MSIVMLLEIDVLIHTKKYTSEGIDQFYFISKLFTRDWIYQI